MKKDGLYILMMASVFFASCSEGQDEPNAVPLQPKTETPVGHVEQSTDPILFAANMEGETKTRAVTSTFGNEIVYGLDGNFHDGIETDADLQQTGFGVYAFYTGTKLIGATGDAKPTDITDKEIVMLNQQVTWDNTNSRWIYSPLRFWPGSTNVMSFFAYAPFTNTASVLPDIGTLNTDFLKQTSGTMNGAYTYAEGKDIVLPTINWTNDSQQDIIWGVARQDGIINANEELIAGKPYKNIHRPSDGTLHWGFRHALARVKFSIFNFMDIVNAYNSTATGIPQGSVTADVGGTIVVSNPSTTLYKAPEGGLRSDR